MNSDKNKKIKLWRRILSVIFIILSVMLAYVLSWSESMFGDVPFAQVIFHLMVPLEGTDSSIISSYFTGVIPIIIVTLLVVSLPFIPDLGLYKKLKDKICKRFFKKKNKEDKEKKGNIIIKFLGAIRRFYTVHLLPVVSVVLVIIIIVDIFGFGIHTWIADRMNSSTIFESYYVDSKTADIEFPADGEKKNIIYILSESLEASFANSNNGGCMDEDLIPNLTILARENTHFSSKDNLAGATEVEGTGWTIAAMVAQMSGVPLMVPIGQNGYGKYSEFLPGITTLGEVLEAEGYVNELIIGSKSQFAGVDTFFESHGNYKIFDYFSAVEAEYIDEDYYRFWGFEDNKLFEYAKEEIRQLESTGKPFNIMINSIDLHTPNGYACTECEHLHGSSKSDKYKDIINCQDRQIYEFVEWCKTQDFYEDTVIIISGDHLSMAPVVKEEYAPEDYERTTYHVIINSAVEPVKTSYRDFTTMDLYPTILASIGCKIKGERLGIGTNLYSDKKTVMEEMGKEKFMEEISKNSVYYNENIVGTK